MIRMLTKATKAQRQRLGQIQNGGLTKSGIHHVFYHMRDNNAITDDMVENLERNGWIEWAGGNMARLTEAGRAALAGGAA